VDGVEISGNRAVEIFGALSLGEAHEGIESAADSIHFLHSWPTNYLDFICGAGNLSVVEGTVSNFHHGAGFSKERFCVGGRCFQYTPEPLPVSFMNSRLQGGPIIRDGLRIHIASAGEAIVRVEIVGDNHVAAR
jgi:hypothetical protein